jgi:type IV secretion system protein VirB10
MDDNRPPFRASEPDEKSRQANPMKLLLMAGSGLVLFLVVLAFERGLFARGSDQAADEPVVTGNVEPLVVRDAPSYATLTERAETPEQEPDVVIVTPKVDPDAEARRLAEKAALESPITFEREQDGRPSGGAAASGQQARLASLADRLQSLADAAGIDDDADPAAVSESSSETSQDYAGVVLDKPYLPPASEHLVQAGTLIPAALITGVNSDLPGEIIAQVTEPIYDSRSGNTLLIPAGAKLLGRYDSLIGYGQDRAFILWDRLLMPNGYSIELDELKGTDKKGQAGVADSVDYHTLRLVSAVLLSSFITVGANVVENSDNNSLSSDLGDAAAQQALGIGNKIVDRQLDVQPTITIRPGWALRVLVNRDIILAPYRRGEQQ